MAVLSNCAILLAGQDNSCDAPIRKFEQQIVVINRSDIDPDSIEIEKTDFNSESPTCKYNGTFALKPGKTGYRFSGPANGSNFFGTYNKSTSDLGFIQYQHVVNMLLTGIEESDNCSSEALDKGSFVVAMQIGNTIQIYGLQNGLSTGDYTYDVQGGGGGTAITLASNENTPEPSKPLVYVSNVPGQEVADFDDLFANTGS